MSRLFLLNASLWRSGRLVTSARFHAGAQLWQKTNQADEDQFGVGSKFAHLDSASAKRTLAKPVDHGANKFLAKPAHVDDSDQFGTLTREHEQVTFQASVTSKRSFNLSGKDKSDRSAKAEDEHEKKYDKVLRHIRLSNDPRERPNNENFYAHRMNEFAKQGKIQEAKNVFFIDMIEKDRFKPTLWLYKSIMRIVSRAGDTKTTFDLFKQMLSYGQEDWWKTSNAREVERILTLLLLACSKIQSPEHAIKKIDSVRSFAKKKGIELNAKHYSAMIMAYGRAGAVYEAFNVVDEMIEKRIKLNSDVFSNLLCAAISQPEKGFHYALKIWQSQLQHKIKPDLNMFNLLLRAARDCNINSKAKIGSPGSQIFKKHLLKIHDPNKKTKRMADPAQPRQDEEPKIRSLEPETLLEASDPDDHSILFKPDDATGEVISLKEDQVHVIDELKVIGKSLESQIMNLQWWQNIRTNIDKKELARDLTKLRPGQRHSLLDSNLTESILVTIDENLDKMIESLTELEDNKVDRLHIMGGLMGVLTAMENFKVKPDHRTANMLLELIPNETEPEELLMKQMKSQVDIDFINFLIRRRIRRRDFEAVDRAFQMIQEKHLTPNIRTFGSLAYKVGTAECLDKYLADLKAFGFKLNPVIVSTLLAQGFRGLNDKLLKHLFEHIDQEGLKLNQENISQVEAYLNAVRSIVIETERRRPESLSPAEQEQYERNRRFFNKTKRLLKRQPEFEALLADPHAKAFVNQQ